MRTIILFAIVVFALAGLAPRYLEGLGLGESFAGWRKGTQQKIKPELIKV